MTAGNLQDVQDAPATAPRESASNFFAALLSSLRVACEQNGLDFAALSQSECEANTAHLVRKLTEHTASALRSEQHNGLGMQTAEEVLAMRTIVDSLAYAVADDPKYIGRFQYIGKVEHLYKSNKRRVLEAFRLACEKKAAGLTLTIHFPTFQTGNPLQDAWYHASLQTYLPRPSAFAVVDADMDSYYTLRTVKTWKEAVQAAQELPIPYNYMREVHAVDAQGMSFDSVDLIVSRRSDEPESLEVPEMAS